MKTCRKCGAYNSNERQFCVDCAERLGSALSEQEEAVCENDIDTRIDKLYNKTDALYVSVFDKIVGFTSLIGMAVLLVFCILDAITKRSMGYLIYGFIVFGCAALIALVPKFLWEIEKIRLSFTISSVDDASPSDWYGYGRKISEGILCLMGVILVCVAFVQLLKPPVVLYIDNLAKNPNVAASSHTSAYIEAKPEVWDTIIKSGDYAVDTFLAHLKKAGQTGLEEQLMMCAIVEIRNMGDEFTWKDKDDFLFRYDVCRRSENMAK